MKNSLSPGQHNSQVAVLAEQIRQAMLYLASHNYTLEQMVYITGGGDKLGRKKQGQRLISGGKDVKTMAMLPHPEVLASGLHVNSLLKVRLLRLGTVGSDDNSRIAWLWNPQIDTFEKLERVLAEAVELGFEFQPNDRPTLQQTKEPRMKKTATTPVSAAAAAPAPKVRGRRAATSTPTTTPIAPTNLVETAPTATPSMPPAKVRGRKAAAAATPPAVTPTPEPTAPAAQLDVTLGRTRGRRSNAQLAAAALEQAAANARALEAAKKAGKATKPKAAAKAKTAKPKAAAKAKTAKPKAAAKAKTAKSKAAAKPKATKPKTTVRKSARSQRSNGSGRSQAAA